MSNKCRYDVFLSHANTDKNVVEKIAHRLYSEAQLQPFLDKWHLVPGQPWQEALEDALNHSRTCAVFLGPAGMGSWEHEEMRAALNQRIRNPSFRVIPILLPKANMPERGRLPAFLARLTWVDFRQNIDDDQAFHRLVCGIKGTMPGPLVLPESPDQIVCPYRGLESFHEHHAAFFFGRNALIQWMQEVLRESRFLGIVGPSGSGKSSVVRAGLIPALLDGKIPGSANWKTIVLTPGPRPLEELAAHLTKLRSEDNQIAQMMSVQDSLRNDSRTLHSAVRLAFTDTDATTRILIVVDQCEELFTLCSDEIERKHFLDNLLYASSIAEGRTVVIFVLRADFYSRAAAYPELADAMSDHQILVTPMTSAELRLAIEAPATSVGLSFDKGLVDTILNDIVDQPAALPLLEHALRQLWEQRQGQRLTLEAYREIGGVDGAVARRAEYEYAELTPEQQTVAEMLLLRLVQPGEGTEDTRRRVYLSELNIGSEPTPVFSVVVQRLVDARLVTIGQDTASGKEQLYVAHEALIRGWPRLRAWLDEDRDALRQHRRLTLEAQEWERLDRDQESLLGGAQLAEAVTWAKAHGSQMNELERTFLESSAKLAKNKIAQEKARQLRELEAARQLAKEAETRRRVQRRAMYGLAGGLVIALLLAGFAGFQWFRAEKQAYIADLAQREMLEQTKISQARQLAAQSEWMPQGSVLAGLLSIESLKRVPTLEGYRAWKKSLALLPKLVTRIPHNSPVDAVSFSSNSRYLATITLDQRITAYELPSARVIDDIPIHSQFWRASIKSDGKLISQAISTAFQLKTLDGSVLSSHKGPGIITPDGWLLTGNQDGTLQLKEIKPGQMMVATGKTHIPEGRTPFIFSADGHLLAESNDRLLTIWKLAEGRVSNKLNPFGIQKVPNDLLMTFSTDGKYLAYVRKGGLGLIDTDKGRLIYALPGAATATLDGADLRPVSVSKGGHPKKREEVNFLVKKIQKGEQADIAGLKEGDTIEKVNSDALSASPTDNAWLQNFRPGDEITLQIIREGKKMEITARLERDNVDIDALLFSSDGKKFFTANQDTIWIWDTLTGNEVSRIFTKKTVMDISADGERIATGSIDGVVRIWDTASGRERVRMIHNDAVRSVLFSPDNKWLATGSDDKTARVWNAVKGDERTRIVHDKSVSGAMFSPDQKWLLTVSEGNTFLWDVFPRSGIHRFNHDAHVHALAFNADGQWLATAGSDKVVRVWDIASGSELARLEHDNRIDKIWFDPDHQQLLTVSGGQLWRWKTNPFGELEHVDAVNEKRLRELDRKTQDDAAAAEVLSLDGRLRAVGSNDGDIRVFENAAEREMSILSHKEKVTAMAFSPDGQWLATASIGGMVQLRLWRPEDLISEACKHLTRDMSSEEWRRYSGEKQRIQSCSDLPIPKEASHPENKLEIALTASDAGSDLGLLMVVDCHLHSSVRQLTQSIFDTIRWRLIKTTAGDCQILGGEYVVFDRASYATALKIWLPKANEGYPEAQTYVGEIYEKGFGGVAKDYSLAAQWYAKAAKQGYSRAQINLGYLYEKGYGVPKDPKTALSWYRKAAGLTNKDTVPADAALIEAIETFSSELNFGHYHALIIGNQLYDKLANLKTAENDAKELSRILTEKYGFETKLLVNANRKTILSTLNELRKKLTGKDNFLIYFAGHSQVDSNNNPYWLPVEADSDSITNWISTKSITGLLNIMEAKHIIVLADALFTETATRAESLVKLEETSVENRKKQLQQLLNRNSRTVLTSGGTKPVSYGNSKHSLFGQTLLETLEQNKGILTGSMLYREVAKLYEIHASEIGIHYKPEYSRIRFANDEFAPFFFVKKYPFSAKTK